jgi:hypothetical protein
MILVFYHDFLIWEEKWYQLCKILECYVCSISQTNVKELKQRKNMNVAPKSLNNEFQIQVCWKGKDWFSIMIFWF